MLSEQLLKRFEEVKPRPGEAAALVDRMKNGIFSEADRQRVLEILAMGPSSPGKRVRHGQGKRRRQGVKASRRRNRCSGAVAHALVSLGDQRSGTAM